MKIVFLILAGGNLVLLAVTFVLGLMVQGEVWFLQHFILGVLATIYTCFVHVVIFTYFTVSLKIIQQAAQQGQSPPIHLVDAAAAVQAAKSRTLRWAFMAILCTLLNATFGALITEPVQAAAWGLSPDWHLLTAFITIGVNLGAFAMHFDAIAGNTARFDRLFSP